MKFSDDDIKYLYDTLSNSTNENDFVLRLKEDGHEIEENKSYLIKAREYKDSVLDKYQWGEFTVCVIEKLSYLYERALDEILKKLGVK